MSKFIKADQWKIIQDDFNKANNRILESIMSLGNGHMGMRGNLEEDYSGDSLQGTYIAGVYYPDKTKVGWWKNGYPEYFAKVLNSTNLIGIKVLIDGENIDLNKLEPIDYLRELDMEKGVLNRTFKLKVNEKLFEFKISRFLSMDKIEIGAIKYSIKALESSATIEFIPYLNGNVHNEDANYDDYFWEKLSVKEHENYGSITLKTKKLNFKVNSSMITDTDKNVSVQAMEPKDNFASHQYKYELKEEESIALYKYFSVTTNRDHEDDQLIDKSKENLDYAFTKGYEQLLEDHKNQWSKIWDNSDIKIKGDTLAQQGIRFNIFQLKQTYHGHDPRLNIGPKGFTGEKYGGSTYWDTEAYCLPFYLSTSEKEISENLLKYRYNHLEKAIENADKLGLEGALYPMVTMNGEECHNEWEITFEEIHRNGAIAYAIYNYIRYTGDIDYLNPKGTEVLLEISRFWNDRIHFSKKKNQYVMLGVTGPNEYENNVNNNWYTNKIATWTLQYTIDVLNYMKENHTEDLLKLYKKHDFNENEMDDWQEIINNMYYPYDEDLDIILQQDNYLDKEDLLVKDIPKDQLPLVKNWSWDRILRSPFIKQADVLQGIFLFDEEFNYDQKKKNYDFYEPRTVHESSLSPCIYSIIASDIGYQEQAYKLYLRTARLDLEDYNSDTNEGLHITSMAGTWMSIVYGFGGFKVKNDKIHLSPFIPKNWDEYNFKLLFRGSLLNIKVTSEQITIQLEKGNDAELEVYENHYSVTTYDDLEIKC